MQDPRFILSIDALTGSESFACIIIPLIQMKEISGILAIYEQVPEALSKETFVVLNQVAPVAAAAVANVNKMRELRDYAHQQQVLYEMSRQIAAGLDLQATLNRALQWVSRLCEVEIGMLWMLEDKEGWLEPVATLGIEIQQAKQVSHPLRELAIAHVILSKERMVLNSTIQVKAHHLATFTQAGLKLQTILVLPMLYRGEVIGVLSLINKIGGTFNKADQTLLTTAVEMIAIAVGNARLYAKTLALIESSDRMHRQSIQNERLATVGRLTASLSHEINNPMQAIRGALTLALEELDQPEEVASYLNLSLEETDRVVKLVNRLREVYRPQQDEPEEMNINEVLEESLAIARKEFSRQDVQVKIQLAKDVPLMLGIPSQLHLVFLSLLLNMSDSLGAIEGEELIIQTRLQQQVIEISFLADAAIMSVASWLETLKSGETVRETNVSFGSSLSHDIIKAHNGHISIDAINQQLIIRIHLPLAASVTDSGIYVFPSSSHR